MKKDIASRIAYYTKKVAERGNVHPSKALPRAYKYRYERLDLYKKLMNARIGMNQQQEVVPEDDDQVIYGLLTVCFAIDIVSVAHRVAGRLSFMDLGEGDKIELLNHQNKVISIEDALANTVSGGRGWNRGESLYEGEKVKVRINSDTTKNLELDKKNYAIRELFQALKYGMISYDEAMEVLLEWESDNQI